VAARRKVKEVMVVVVEGRGGVEWSKLVSE
jgi:hypothetical protein